MGPDNEPAAGKRDKLLRTKVDIEAKIYNIIDNISPATREFADKRVTQLKDELARIALELEHLEVAEARKADIDAMLPELMEYMKDFGRVYTEGTVEEKRTFLRAFIRRVELDPETGKGRLEIFSLPRIQALPPDGDNASNSSLILVAGAGFEPATSGL